jgi:hypothetical protein
MEHDGRNAQRATTALSLYALPLLIACNGTGRSENETTASDTRPPSPEAKERALSRYRADCLETCALQWPEGNEGKPDARCATLAGMAQRACERACEREFNLMLNVLEGARVTVSSDRLTMDGHPLCPTAPVQLPPAEKTSSKASPSTPTP